MAKKPCSSPKVPRCSLKSASLRIPPSCGIERSVLLCSCIYIY
ncbi:hypothetical protein GCWU000341_01927 [Oribacterium sp. oral taxon 078 str. F0262]|nr:hypothetical protein GCWU000341_01927 [Oribacterium sp. oral taxon 078 str. F0262]